MSKSPSQLFIARVIDGSRFYICLKCGRRYITRSGISQHVKRKHLR
ncbi:MAG: hypothetical protein QXV23_04950 [Candidatus Bathyarchaeia archaeon]